MRKSTTMLLLGHFIGSRTPLSALVLVALLFTTRPAAAQEAIARLTPKPSYHAEFYSDAVQSAEAVREAKDEPVSVSVSPNPTAGKFLVSLKGNKEDRVRVKVLDKHGCVIDNHEVSALSNLQLGFWYYPGTYQLQIIQGDNTQTVKLEKLKD